MTVNDVAAAPNFEFRDETTIDIARRSLAPFGFLLVAAGLIGIVGIRMFRNFSVA